MTEILREIKHGARIPVPDSYLLVGVADEGPAYVGKPGYEKVHCLSEHEIYGQFLDKRGLHGSFSY